MEQHVTLILAPHLWTLRYVVLSESLHLSKFKIVVELRKLGPRGVQCQ
jgi:hypothetical protein